jgi:hypothetical protein
MIKRSALPKGVITKLLGDTKLVKPLQDVLRGKKLSGCETSDCHSLIRTGASTNKKIVVFENDNVKYDIVLGANFLSKTGIKLNYSEGNMEWFDCSIPLCLPDGLDSKEFDTMEVMFHIKSKTRSLVKFSLNALHQRFWMPCMLSQM